MDLKIGAVVDRRSQFGGGSYLRFDCISIRYFYNFCLSLGPFIMHNMDGRVFYSAFSCKHVNMAGRTSELNRK
jgi:hypothetical protein